MLAVALGNGEVRLFSIPHPNVLTTKEQPLCVVELTPVVSTVVTAGRSPLSIGWGIDSPNTEMLAVGFDNGDVGIYAFGEVCEDTAEASFVFSASAGALRTVEWSPAEPWILATAGHDGCMRIWNVLDPYFPLASKTLTRGWVLCATWYDSTSVIYGTDSSVLQCWNMLDADSSLATYKGAVWGVAMQGPYFALSASADGRVQAVPLLIGEDRKKKRSKKSPKTEDVFSVSLGSKQAKQGLCFGKKHEGHADLRDGFDATGIAWHAVACSSASGGHVWRAAVGSAGVLAVQSIDA